MPVVLNRDKVQEFLRGAPPGAWVPGHTIRDALGLSDAMASKVLKELTDEGVLEREAVAKYAPRAGAYKAGGPMAPYAYRIAKGTSTHGRRHRRRDQHQPVAA